MRHSNSGRKFSRTPSHRKVLLQNLTKALLSNGQIKTTQAKAKDLRGVIEPLITQARRNDLHSRRLAYAYLNNHRLVKYLFDEVAPLFVGVPGGYTRVVKLAMPRKGDNAPMAIIQFTKQLPVSYADFIKKLDSNKSKAKEEGAETAEAGTQE